MSTLSSTSTLAQIKAAYADNASYEEDDDATKAQAFITACRMLMMNLPKRTVHGGRGEEVELPIELIEKQLTAARSWRGSHGGLAAGGAGVKHADFRDFRE